MRGIMCHLTLCAKSYAARITVAGADLDLDPRSRFGSKAISEYQFGMFVVFGIALANSNRAKLQRERF